MKVFILDWKINYNGQWEEIDVVDNFFDDYKESIDKYTFELNNGELLWKFEWKETSILSADERELAEIDIKLRAGEERYTHLEKIWIYRSRTDEEEFQTLETAKNTLLARRKEILDSII